jgi:hypothetical protein
VNLNIKYTKSGLKLSILFAIGLTVFNVNAQKDRKVSFVGGARSLMNSNSLIVNDTTADTSTIKRKNGGYALLDLGVNIKPNKNTEIMGMFRIRNEYGGFWGSGVSFDVRQLWIKGVVANALRYQLGDLNLKQTQFTLYNHHSDQLDSLPSIFNLQKNIVSYDRFYMGNNSWRMQGASVDFGFTFSKFIKEINVNAFITRLNATDFANINDRLMRALTLQIVQSKNLFIAFNNNTVFDVKGTVKNDNLFKNSVNTIDFKYYQKIGKENLLIAGELGQSNYQYSADTLAPKLNDYFMHFYAQMKVSNFNATLGFLSVGPDFRSIGSQSKDVNYNAQTVFYNRYTNAQVQRPVALIDLIGNENIYNRSISNSLMTPSQIYNTISPYGMATFNRQGAYVSVQYKSKQKIELNAEYQSSKEIRGQGSNSLREFSQTKVFAYLPLHEILGLKRHLSIQASNKMQTAKRNSQETIENVDLKMNQMSVGLKWEFSEGFELLGGFINQTNKGTDFIADRNAYSEVIYFYQNNLNLTQQIKAVGLRYNFSPKVYLAILYQQSTYKDQTKTNANFNMNQLGVIYSITL